VRFPSENPYKESTVEITKTGITVRTHDNPLQIWWVWDTGSGRTRRRFQFSFISSSCKAYV